jgi:hypothetical protein
MIFSFNVMTKNVSIETLSFYLVGLLCIALGCDWAGRLILVQNAGSQLRNFFCAIILPTFHFLSTSRWSRRPDKSPINYPSSLP